MTPSSSEGIKAGFPAEADRPGDRGPNRVRLFQLAEGLREGLRSICLSVESGSGIFHTHLRSPFARTFLPLLGTTASHVCVSVAPGAPRLLQRALPAPGFSDSLMGHTQTGRSEGLHTPGAVLEQRGSGSSGWMPLSAGDRCAVSRALLTFRVAPQRVLLGLSPGCPGR